jgi:uncharacterized protein (TIGR03437 family)
MGDILLACTGTPRTSVVANFNVFLSVPVTNRIGANGRADAALTPDTGGGAVSGVVSGPNRLLFPGVAVTLPDSGQVQLRITNVRGAPGAQGVDNATPILAALGSDGPDQVVFSAANVAVGVPQRGLLAGSSATTVNCYGSPLPAQISIPGLIAAGTRSFSTRVTEGFVSAFDAGLRIVVTYTGFPAGARLFVPDAVAGSGGGSLLLVRIAGAGADGSGGTRVFAPGPGVNAADGAGEVPLTGGSGMAVYEVADSNPSVRESAQIPTFLGLAPTGGGFIPGAGLETVTLGPVSTVAQATMSDPVPRFLAVAPPPDCSVLGDCASFPQLVVIAATLDFASETDGHIRGDYVWLKNSGGGTLAWNYALSYQDGAGWVRLTFIPPYGASAGAIEVVVSPKGLAPGVYRATLSIDAGAAGRREIPITFTVTGPVPTVMSVLNSASLAPGPVAPGSLATLRGVRLAGRTVGVTLDGIAARLLYADETQINLEIPEELGTKTTAQLVVTADGVSGSPFAVALAPVAPAVFPNGVVTLGRYLVIYATGLPSAQLGAISTNLAGRDIESLAYAGPAPTLPGIEQINLPVPPDLSGQTAELEVCGTRADTGQRTCSPAVQVRLP